MKLTVQPYSYGKFRFGLSVEDSYKYFKKRFIEVILLVKGKQYRTHTTCGNINKRKKAFDLCSTEISALIINKKWNKYDKGNPTKLLFEINNTKSPIQLLFKQKLTKTKIDK